MDFSYEAEMAGDNLDPRIYPTSDRLQTVYIFQDDIKNLNQKIRSIYPNIRSLPNHISRDVDPLLLY